MNEEMICKSCGVSIHFSIYKMNNGRCNKCLPGYNGLNGKSRYIFTIIDPDVSVQVVKHWVKKHWEYDYCDEKWYFGYDFLLKLSPTS